MTAKHWNRQKLWQNMSENISQTLLRRTSMLKAKRRINNTCVHTHNMESGAINLSFINSTLLKTLRVLNILILNLRKKKKKAF